MLIAVPMRVFVLLFNDPKNQGGIHTLRLGDRNLILMFESEDDATRYALLLEAQDFMSPSVEPIESEEIEEFCRDADYDCQLVPEGFVPEEAAERLLLAPPETNLEQTDWEQQAQKEPESDLDQIRRRLEGLI